jgi:membrane-associated phospholipid phosphatase
VPESEFDESVAPIRRCRQQDRARYPVRVALLLLAWMALVGALIGVGELVTHSSRVQGFDHHVTSIVVANRSAGLNVVMKAVTWLGSWVALLVAAAVLVVLVLRGRLPVRFLVLAVLLFAGTQGATTLTKQVVQRPRPPEHLRLVTAHGWSWPSGHTATATLVFAILAAVVWALTSRVGPRVVAVLGWILLVGAVGFSRVELGVHWTTDVLASAIFVAGLLLVAGLLFGRLPRPHAEEGSPSESAIT